MIVLYGCTTVVEIKRQDAFYKDRPEKLPLRVGLFLSDKEKNHVLRAPTIPTTEYKIGNALEVEAIASLKKVFSNISIVNNNEGVSPDIDRIIAIKFGPEAKEGDYNVSWETVEVKVFGGSKSKYVASVELICEVYDKNWNLLWKETLMVTANLEREFPGGGGAGGAYEIAAIAMQSREKVVINSLVSGLEQINDKILTSGKGPILRGR